MFMVSLVTPVIATQWVSPPTREQMTGAWFGFDNHRNFLRLDLKADGSGTLVWLQLGGQSRSVFDIPKWEWTAGKRKLDVSVKPRTSQYEDIWLRVENAGWSEIAISFGGKRLKWDRTAKLMNERMVLDNLKAATVE
jgi:hypothetical protein